MLLTPENLRRLIPDMQDTVSSLERCRKPVLAAVHGGCIGGGIDLITCARDHSVADGLNDNATWNAAMLLADDLQEAMSANAGKRAPSLKN